jgi:hypothetical protein
MRISYKYGIRTISGKLDGLVHSAWNKGRVAIGRLFVMPTLGQAHFNFRDIKRNIAVIWNSCSQNFKDDLKAYTIRRIPYYTAEQIPAYANYANFIKFLYAYSRENASVDLRETTKEELELSGCPGSVNDIIMAEYLPKVNDSSDLNNDW